MRIIIVWLMILVSVFAVDISRLADRADILPYCRYYVDETQNLSFNQVRHRPFKRIDKPILHFGFAPKFRVWIRCDLFNGSTEKIARILQYANPLTAEVALYEDQESTPKSVGGMYRTQSRQLSLSPAFQLRFQPHQKHRIYLSAATDVTTLIVRLRLYTPDAFYRDVLRHQLVLALFFGMMAFVIIYHAIVYVATRDKSYLYYVLFFGAMSLHQLLYRGMGHAYLFDDEWMKRIIPFAAFITFAPALFLALFMNQILHLKNDKRLYRILTTSIVIAVASVVLLFFAKLDAYRNLPAVGLVLVVIGILLIRIFRKDTQAMLIATGWFLFVFSVIAMQLSSSGTYEIFTRFPYFSEFALAVEAALFSLVLSNKLKRLQQEKLDAQARLIEQQRLEEKRLGRLVEERTAKLSTALNEKQLLLKELNHRVKNSLQTILSFVRLQRYTTSHSETKHILNNLENRIFAVDNLHVLLFDQEHSMRIDAQRYFGRIVRHLQESFARSDIEVKLEADAILDAKEAIYCGLILNEAITNAFLHGFASHQGGTIVVRLERVEPETFQLTVHDDGCGISDVKSSKRSLGLHIIRSLVETQLHGSFRIQRRNGTYLCVAWERQNNAE